MISIFSPGFVVPVSKQDFGNTNRGGYQVEKVDEFRDKEFYTGSGLLNQEVIP